MIRLRFLSIQVFGIRMIISNHARRGQIPLLYTLSFCFLLHVLQTCYEIVISAYHHPITHSAVVVGFLCLATIYQQIEDFCTRCSSAGEHLDAFCTLNKYVGKIICCEILITSLVLLLKNISKGLPFCSRQYLMWLPKYLKCKLCLHNAK